MDTQMKTSKYAQTRLEKGEMTRDKINHTHKTLLLTVHGVDIVNGIGIVGR